jgi:hypothetical protein
MSDAIIPPQDDLVDVVTQWGIMPKWKARALALGEMQAALVEHVRADSASAQVTPLRDTDNPPPVAADETRARAKLTDAQLREIEDACDRLDERLTALEARRDAERRLEELEDALEASGIAPDEDRQIKLH